MAWNISKYRPIDLDTAPESVLLRMRRNDQDPRSAIAATVLFTRQARADGDSTLVTRYERLTEMHHNKLPAVLRWRVA